MSNKIEHWINPDGAPELSPQTLQQVKSQVRLIDVRRPDEFNAELGHIEGAKLSTLENQLESELDQMDKGETYVFICRSGGRSTRATLMAKEKGFQNVFNLQGGMIRWNALGLPVER